MHNNKKPQYEHQGDQLRLTFKNEAPEQSRAYTFPGGDLIEVKGVVRALVSRHGYHFLECNTGVNHVVRPSWLIMTIDSEGSHEAPQEYKEKAG
jgi:hypothetical protein